jgi:hypothetical protein
VFKGKLIWQPEENIIKIDDDLYEYLSLANSSLGCEEENAL